MYLDDLILVSADREPAAQHYQCARRQLQDLALPEVVEKAQPPPQKVKWLGINIDTVEMTLAIPNDKLGNGK